MNSHSQYRDWQLWVKFGPPAKIIYPGSQSPEWQSHPPDLTESRYHEVERHK